jgi:hypothetical protein
MGLIWGKREAEYFLRRGWTTQITLICLKKSPFWRSGFCEIEHFSRQNALKPLFAAAPIRHQGFQQFVKGVAVMRMNQMDEFSRPVAYALRLDVEDARILLPGDADYQWVPPTIANSVNRIMVPHHGATGSSPPSPSGGGNPVAVVSYGIPNTYRHPSEDQIDAHRCAGWRIRRTAAHGNPTRPRGNRTLYPI